MMDINLIAKLKPIEEEFNCNLFTFDEALCFLKSDLEVCNELINDEISFYSSTPNPLLRHGFREGLKKALEIINTVIESRIKEGY